jgi:hypothetical protein
MQVIMHLVALGIASNFMVDIQGGRLVIMDTQGGRVVIKNFEGGRVVIPEFYSGRIVNCRRMYKQNI